MLYLSKSIKTTAGGGVQMREDIYQFELIAEARVRTSGTLLIVDPACVKDVKCDWFKHFAPKSAYDLAENRESLTAVRQQHYAALDERVGNTGGVATARHVARWVNKIIHYRDLSHRIVEAAKQEGLLIPPQLVQGQHGVYFRTGYAPGGHQIIEEKDGYAVFFGEASHPEIHSEVSSKSGMLMVIDGKATTRENMKFETGVNHSEICKIAVPKGMYSCSFSKDGLKLRIKKI